MTAIITSRMPRGAASGWERMLFTASRRLERSALHHMRRRAAAADREAFVCARIEHERDVRAAAALRLFER